MRVKILFLVALCCLGVSSINAQNQKENLFKVSGQVDLKSMHYWRGSQSGLAPAIEPCLTVAMKNLSLSLWGGYTFDDKYREIDLILTYSYDKFAVTIADYYNPVFGLSFPDHMFNLHANSTVHLVDGILEYSGSKYFPLHVSASVLLYGDDKDANGKNLYSTYIELSKDFELWKLNFNAFAGFTPANSLYADKFAWVNTGLKAGYTFRLNNKLSLPISSSLLINPYREKVFGRLSLSLVF